MPHGALGPCLGPHHSAQRRPVPWEGASVRRWQPPRPLRAQGCFARPPSCCARRLLRAACGARVAVCVYVGCLLCEQTLEALTMTRSNAQPCLGRATARQQRGCPLLRTAAIGFAAATRAVEPGRDLLGLLAPHLDTCIWASSIERRNRPLPGSADCRKGVRMHGTIVFVAASPGVSAIPASRRRGRGRTRMQLGSLCHQHFCPATAACYPSHRGGGVPHARRARRKCAPLAPPLHRCPRTALRRSSHHIVASGAPWCVIYRAGGRDRTRGTRTDTMSRAQSQQPARAPNCSVWFRHRAGARRHALGGPPWLHSTPGRVPRCRCPRPARRSPTPLPKGRGAAPRLRPPSNLTASLRRPTTRRRGPRARVAAPHAARTRRSSTNKRRQLGRAPPRPRVSPTYCRRRRATRRG